MPRKKPRAGRWGQAAVSGTLVTTMRLPARLVEQIDAECAQAAIAAQVGDPPSRATMVKALLEQALKVRALGRQGGR